MCSRYVMNIAICSIVKYLNTQYCIASRKIVMIIINDNNKYLYSGNSKRY